MENSEPINFVDIDSRDAASISVRFDASSVALGVSLKSDGDIEVVMTKETARLVVAALQNAIDRNSQD